MKKQLSGLTPNRASLKDTKRTSVSVPRLSFRFSSYRTSKGNAGTEILPSTSERDDDNEGAIVAVSPMSLNDLQSDLLNDLVHDDDDDDDESTSMYTDGQSYHSRGRTDSSVSEVDYFAVMMGVHLNSTAVSQQRSQQHLLKTTIDSRLRGNPSVSTDDNVLLRSSSSTLSASNVIMQEQQQQEGIPSPNGKSVLFPNPYLVPPPPNQPTFVLKRRTSFEHGLFSDDESNNFEESERSDTTDTSDHEFIVSTDLVNMDDDFEPSTGSIDQTNIQPTVSSNIGLPDQQNQQQQMFQQEQLRPQQQKLEQPMDSQQQRQQQNHPQDQQQKQQTQKQQEEEYQRTNQLHQQQGKQKELRHIREGDDRHHEPQRELQAVTHQEPQEETYQEEEEQQHQQQQQQGHNALQKQQLERRLQVQQQQEQLEQPQQPQQQEQKQQEQQQNKQEQEQQREQQQPEQQQVQQQAQPQEGQRQQPIKEQQIVPDSAVASLVNPLDVMSDNKCDSNVTSNNPESHENNPHQVQSSTSSVTIMNEDLQHQNEVIQKVGNVTVVDDKHNDDSEIKSFPKDHDNPNFTPELCNDMVTTKAVASVTIAHYNHDAEKATEMSSESPPPSPPSSSQYRKYDFLKVAIGIVFVLIVIIAAVVMAGRKNDNSTIVSPTPVPFMSTSAPTIHNSDVRGKPSLSSSQGPFPSTSTPTIHDTERKGKPSISPFLSSSIPSKDGRGKSSWSPSAISLLFPTTVPVNSTSTAVPSVGLRGTPTAQPCVDGNEEFTVTGGQRMDCPTLAQNPIILIFECSSNSTISDICLRSCNNCLLGRF